MWKKCAKNHRTQVFVLFILAVAAPCAGHTPMNIYRPHHMFNPYMVRGPAQGTAFTEKLSAV